MEPLSFDETVRILLSEPVRFRKLWASSQIVREQRGLHNESLLHFLAVENNPTAVRILSELGADVNATNSNGDTALHDCVALGNADMTALLLSLGANPNKPNAQGNTAVHIAFENQVRDIVFRKLLEAGGDLSLKNKLGQTPEKTC